MSLQQRVEYFKREAYEATKEVYPEGERHSYSRFHIELLENTAYKAAGRVVELESILAKLTQVLMSNLPEGEKYHAQR